MFMSIQELLLNACKHESHPYMCVDLKRMKALHAKLCSCTQIQFSFLASTKI